MSARFPILRSLDPHHQRVGYLNGVLLSAVRGLDSRDSLVARFFDLMFERVYEGDALWDQLIARVPAQYRPQLLAEAEQAQKNDPTSILKRNRTLHGWVYIHELWRYSSEIYSRLGGIKNEEDK